MAALDTTKITRLELMRTKSKVRVATKGLSLLKMKRSRLILEFFTLAKTIEKMNLRMSEASMRAIDSIKIAEAYSGRISLERIAAEQTARTIGVSVKNVMGVRIPDVQMGSQPRLPVAYDMISVPTSVEDARRGYEQLLKGLIEISEKENSLRRLLYEIEKTNRRANSIENIVITGLNAKARYITQRLEDLERDQTVSLKYMKKRIGDKRD